jgi:hypothetical protein
VLAIAAVDALKAASWPKPIDYGTAAADIVTDLRHPV